MSYKGDYLNMEWAEISALVEGISMVRTFNFDRVIFEFNYVSIVNRFCKYGDDIIILGYRIDEVKSMIDFFTEAEVRWISRNKNKVVDKFYSMAMKNFCNLSFELEYFSDIH